MRVEFEAGGLTSHGLTRQTDAAVDAFRRIVQENPNFLPAHAYRAALFAEMGRDEEARAAWRQTQQLSPGASLASIRQRLPYRRPADLDRFLAAARRAGLQ
jgi:predicted RNA polymerase sigma factor